MDSSDLSPPCIDYFIRFVQVHETFRRPEIEALALLANINIEFLRYSESVSPTLSSSTLKPEISIIQKANMPKKQDERWKRFSITQPS